MKKYIIIEMTSSITINSICSEKREKMLIEFKKADENKNFGYVELHGVKVLKRKNSNTILELSKDEQYWRYRRDAGIENDEWFPIEGMTLTKGYYHKNVLKDKKTAELLFELG